MSTLKQRLATHTRQSPYHAALIRAATGFLIAVIDVAAIIAASIAAGVVYHLAAYEQPGQLRDYVSVGALAAMLFVGPGIWSKDYTAPKAVKLRQNLKHAFPLWNSVALCLLVLGFLTKMTDVYSRGALVLFYVAAIPMIGGGRALARSCVLLAQRHDMLPARRVLVIGTADQIECFLNRVQGDRAALRIAGLAELRDGDDLTRDLDDACDLARRLRPDAVFLAAPWSDQALVWRVMDRFRAVPVELHLTPDQELERFGKLTLSQTGALTSLQLSRAPLTLGERTMKRAFDLAGASLALLLVAPVLAVAALLIRLDSPGPVMFRQRRYGFNQEPFQIWKLRTMTVQDDGDVIVQARRGDPRVTRVGAVLRRFNIDELPQLINVLKGEMSLVGPRPHALAHDHAFEKKVAYYARRNHVKPGITGWAQVNGWRGAIDTDEAIAARVAHDLHYIDHWSFWFDVEILFLTVFSPKAYVNAV